jgi:chemotaxis protein histidine kinase CheA
MNKEEFTLLVTKVGLSVADIEGSIAELLKLKPELAATEEATPAEGAAEKDEEASPALGAKSVLDQIIEGCAAAGQPLEAEEIAQIRAMSEEDQFNQLTEINKQIVEAAKEAAIDAAEADEDRAAEAKLEAAAEADRAATAEAEAAVAAAAGSDEEVAEVPAEAKVEAPTVDEVAAVEAPAEAAADLSSCFTLLQLTSGDALPDGVDPTKKETYLDDTEFEAVFKVDKATFAALPQWKKAQVRYCPGCVPVPILCGVVILFAGIQCIVMDAVKSAQLSSRSRTHSGTHTYSAHVPLHLLICCALMDCGFSIVPPSGEKVEQLVLKRIWYIWRMSGECVRTDRTAAIKMLNNNSQPAVATNSTACKHQEVPSLS